MIVHFNNYIYSVVQSGNEIYTNITEHYDEAEIHNSVH